MQHNQLIKVIELTDELRVLIEQLTQISKDIAYLTVCHQKFFLRRTILFTLLLTASLSTIAVNTLWHGIPRINISLYYVKFTTDTDTTNVVVAVFTALTFIVMLADLIRKAKISARELKEKIHEQTVIKTHVTNIFLGSDDYVP